MDSSIAGIRNGLIHSDGYKMNENSFFLTIVLVLLFSCVVFAFRALRS